MSNSSWLELQDNEPLTAHLGGVGLVPKTNEVLKPESLFKVTVINISC